MTPMTRYLIVLGALAALWVGSVGVGGTQVVRAASGHDAAPSFLIGTLEGTGYAPKGGGTVSSPGYRDRSVVYIVRLHDLPAPSTLGGAAYKVWLVDPASATVMPGGVLDYHADGTAIGTFVSRYHDFSVLVVTPEKNLYGTNPENDKVVEGSVDLRALQAALTTHVPQLAVTETHVPAAYFKSAAAAGSTVGQATLPRNSVVLTVHNAAATATSTILLMPLGDPHGTLWISARGMGAFTISASGRRSAGVKVQYLIINN